MEPIINENNSIWLVTGTSSGLGLELVKKLLVTGNKVAAFTRSPQDLSETLKELLVDFGNNLFIVKTDITNDEDVKNATEKTIKHFGKIDVVVNNHGYGLIGAVEELSDSEFKEIFNVNFFGVLNVLRHTVPHLRKQKSGTIFNVSSLLGWVDFQNYSAYDSTKHALNAVTFSLAKELQPFGIDVVLLSPGGFRTSFVGGNLRSPINPISDYNTHATIDFMSKYSKIAKGDPIKYANLVIELSKLKQKPDNIFIGTDSASGAKEFLEKTLKSVDKWYDLSTSTDYPPNEGNEQIPKFDI